MKKYPAILSIVAAVLTAFSLSTTAQTNIVTVTNVVSILVTNVVTVTNVVDATPAPAPAPARPC